MDHPNRFDCQCLHCGRSYSGTRASILCPTCRAEKKWVCPQKRKAFQTVLDERHRLYLQRVEDAKVAKVRREEAKLTAATELLAREEAAEREARERKRRRETCQQQIEWLKRRTRRPKGRIPMKADIAATGLGQLWRDLCHADGQVNCLTRATTIAPEVRETLTVAHLRLRMAGHSAASVAKVCPVALLEDTSCTLAAALKALPASDPTPKTESQERDRLRTLLGL